MLCSINSSLLIDDSSQDLSLAKLSISFGNLKSKQNLYKKTPRGAPQIGPTIGIQNQL